MKGFGKRILGSQTFAWRGWPYLFVLLVCFFIGALCGLILAFWGEPSVELQNYLIDYFDVAAKRELSLSFLSVFWDCVQWPLFVLVFGFTALGAVAIPAIFLVRGFLLSYTASCFSVLLGHKGVAAAAVLFAVTVFLILPVLFVMGCENLRSACMHLPGQSISGEGLLKPEILLPSVGVLMIAVALQWTIAPIMLSAVCVRLF